ncbi:MAG: protein kinase [Planctomycetota bacterium]|nr:protein kinase [Planctomycetota bacterium]
MEPDQHPVPLEVAMRIEKICSEFESAWQVQKPSQLENLLLLVEDNYRPDLLSELLLLEFHYRQTGPDAIEIQDYQDRFPEHKQLVNQAWERLFGRVESPAPDQPDSAQNQTIQAKYAKRKLHRQGGIGRIWIAHDRNLNRKVALKDLQPQYTEDPVVRERFIREAQITGKLEHPNIVPVYQLRQGSDITEPLYTMRLVEGKTFRELIAQCHIDRNNQSPKRRDQVHLLNILTTVCQTIAYAHSQGVIHRDLKPDNVVVGDFGEVFVLDWGLAKLMEEPAESPDEPVIAPVATSTETNRTGETIAGTRIGTPAYMAPEQAAGATDQIGVPTDIYGLGTILFEILTGEPPHHAADSEELIKQIQQTPTPAARALNAAVAPALEAICLKAMSKDPSNRYASALDLKNEVQSWMADEPIDCYTDSWWTRCSRWTRLHRRLINSAALLMLLATVGLGIGNRLLNRAHRQTKEEKETAERAVSALERTKKNAETDFRRARTVIEGLSLEINSPQAQKLSGFKPLQRQLAEKLLDFYSYFLERHREEPAFRAEIADVHYQLGVLTNSLETLDSARLHYENALKLFLQLSKDEPEHKPYQRKLSKCYNGLGNLFQGSGDLAAAETNYLEAAKILTSLTALQPADDTDRQRQMTVLNNLAALHMIRGNTAQAIANFQQILAPQQGQPAAPMTALATHLNLSVLYRTAGDLSQSGSSLAEAEKILDRLRKEQFNPELLHAHQLGWYINQSNLEMSFGRWEAAGKTSTAGVQAAQALVENHPGEFKYQVSLALLNLNATAIWIKRGDPQQASTSAQKAISILRRLREKDPENLQYQMDLSRGLHNLAQAERQLQLRETALKTIRLAIKEKQQIVERIPEDKYRHLLLTSRVLYANIIMENEEHLKALREYRELHTIARDLLERNQQHLPYQSILATIVHGLARMEKENKEWDSSREHFREAVKLQKQLSARSPNQVKLILDTSITQYNFGNLHQVQSELEPALVLYHEAYNTLLRLPKVQHKQANVHRQLINCHWAIAETSHALKQFPAALKHWDEALKLAKDDKFRQFLTKQRQKTAELLPDEH